MIINNKLYLLSDIYKISDKEKKNLKIKLMIMNNIRINLSFMHHDCKELKKFSLISEKGTKETDEDIFKKVQKNREINTINRNDSNELNNQLSHEFYGFIKAIKTSKKIHENTKVYKSTIQRKKLNFIYILLNKNIISEEDKKKVNEIIIKSHNFLLASSSFNYSVFEDDYNNEYSSYR